jgi:hypothetical protein
MPNHIHKCQSAVVIANAKGRFSRDEMQSRLLFCKASSLIFISLVSWNDPIGTAFLGGNSHMELRRHFSEFREVVLLNQMQHSLSWLGTDSIFFALFG